MSLADKLTFLRILLVPVFALILFYLKPDSLYLRYWAIGVFILAVLTDFFDGMVARIKKEKSQIGHIIDPLADKLLLLTAFISLYCLRHHLGLQFQIPLWLVLIIVSRDVLILLGLAVLNFMKIEMGIFPSMSGKLTTVFQMAVILSVLLDFKIFPVICVLAGVFTIVSGVEYFSRGIRAINERNKLSSNTR